MKKILVASMAAAALAAVAPAQFIIDGSKDSLYPASNAFQTNATGFGDSNAGQLGNGNGSELDGVFAEITSTHLNILFTGNLESNFNKLEFFLDTQAGGQNTLRNDNPDVDFNHLNRLAGLTFDTDFVPDYYFTFGHDGTNGYLNFATLLTSGGGTGGYLGSVTPGGNGTLTGGTNPSNVLFAYNNSNIGGVTGTDATGASAVTTGFEFSIPLALIGNPTFGTGLKVSTMINGSGNDFLSNQVLGGLPAGTANLGDPANVNFANIAGNQYVPVPEPASMAAMGLGLVGLLARRRRKA